MTLLRLNSTGDKVKELQSLLNKQGYSLITDGHFGRLTENAVKDYQSKNNLAVDGIVGNITMNLLRGSSSNNKTLSNEDILWASKQLNCEPAAIKAVSEVESAGSGYLQDGRLTILYERHIMRRRLIAYKIDPVPYIKSHPNLVNTATGGYSGGVREHDRLNKAKEIHELAAMDSCSWGMYQIMGYHAQALGYKDVKGMVSSMEESSRGHLDAFVRFIKLDTNLLRAIQNKDWSRFARLYNGPGYAANKYDTKIASAYNRYRNENIV